MFFFLEKVTADPILRVRLVYGQTADFVLVFPSTGGPFWSWMSRPTKLFWLVKTSYVRQRHDESVASVKFRDVVSIIEC